ncbi:MAG TPA: hypothetical protein VKQ54_00730 [Caulobacteraceae bacterium]|nr:hypothetical protein [Caulobacteraceae bacterium]
MAPCGSRPAGPGPRPCLQHLVPASRKAYEQFFTDRKDADPDMPPLRAAKAEYAAL